MRQGAHVSLTVEVMLASAAPHAEVRNVARRIVAAAAGPAGDGDLADPTGALNMPDPVPKAPRLVGVDQTGVVDKCAAIGQKMATKLGWQVARTFVSKEEKWGVVWRADMAPPDDPGSAMRDTCWGRSGGGFGFFIQPLSMFDPQASVAPLPAN
jgi:hypothetical protein